MSSTNKTMKMGLNSWIGSDVPQREDFNNDNSIIENTVVGHIENASCHVTSSEKQMWNSPCVVMTYYGDGADVRTINLDIPFIPKVALVIAAEFPPSLIDISNEANYNYFGVATYNGSQFGLSLVNKSLSITATATGFRDTEFVNYNQHGVRYVLLVFR